MLSDKIFLLSISATVALVVMWVTFWIAVIRSGESIIEVLLNQAFFRTVTVMGVIAATAVLSLAENWMEILPGQFSAV
jgi:hypothetical protein